MCTFRRGSARILGAAAVLIAAMGSVLAPASPLPPVVAPVENPFTEAKRVLGKILFWDEQLSSDDTVACGTCHAPSRGGADTRRARHPGADGVLGTADDLFGSPGVVHRNATGEFVPHAVFGLGRQVTGRTAPSALTGALADGLFWDGRAAEQFVDPQTGLVAIAAGGALESQSLGPPLSATEMAAEGRTWTDVAAKLATVAPLALATDLPADVASALAATPGYPALFAAAFGDPAISAQRLAFAVATYERTLVPDQTPWDRFMDGDASALTAAQRRGWDAFQTSRCNDCHRAPEFTDRSFRNTGLRPIADDAGRAAITGDTADRGRFKVPSLRNVGLRASFMHGGWLTSLTDVLRFYARAPGTEHFTENRDPIIAQMNPSPAADADIQVLLSTGLTDPRAAAETAPFDRPVLYSERSDHGPLVSGAGRAGSGGAAPGMVAVMPPYLGNAEFRLGVHGALGGARAFLAVSSSAPAGERLPVETLLGPVTLDGAGVAAGYGTIRWPVPDDRSRAGEHVWFQWRVSDPVAAGGVALSPVAAVTLVAVQSTSLPAPVVTDDADLYVTAAAFTVDWRRHASGIDADTFSVSGLRNAAPLDSVEGASFALSLAGAELIRTTLDGDGRAASGARAMPSWSVRVDPTTGRFTASASHLDLRPVLGLDSLADRGRTTYDVRVGVEGAGGATDTTMASVPFVWRTAEGRRTRGAHRYGRDGLATGVFLPWYARALARGRGVRSLRIDGALDPPGHAVFVPTGDIRVHVGSADLVLPAAAIVVRGVGPTTTVRAVVHGGGTAPSILFRYVARTRTFSLWCDRLPATVLPGDGAVRAALSLVLASTTPTGDAVFATTVRLHRASPRSAVWRRPAPGPRARSRQQLAQRARGE